MATTVRSFSKINLGLAIGPARPDGFHALTTLYQTLDVHDLVTVEARPAATTAIHLTCTDARVPTDHRNTAWKAAELALATSGVTAQVTIHIEKRLPIQGGMGAGSANAAATMIALETELEKHGQIPLCGADRLEIAAQIGSDVPLFLIGGAVLGLGRGEEVYPMPDLPATRCIVALPEIGVSTPHAFRIWDSQHGQPAALTGPQPSDRIRRLSRAFAASLCEPHSSGVFTSSGGLAENSLLALVRTGIENDFEEVVFPEYPFLGQIKRALQVSDIPERSALYASLSGSGSALFGLYATDEAAESVIARLEGLGVRSLRTKTLPRSLYWRSMVMESME